MSPTKHIKTVKNYTVVQANDLIRNKKEFSLWELRVFALLASHVKKEDEDFQTYRFRIKELLDLFETKSNNLYEELKNIPEKLHARIIKIPYQDNNGKQRLKRYNLISMSDVPDDKNLDEGEYIELRFDKDLKPLMLKLGEHFTVYKFYNILKLRSSYIFQLYELLKSQEYKASKSIEFDLSELIEILQIPKSYKYGNIKQRILLPAKEQLEEYTDIVFDFTPIKGRGGKIIKLGFQISKNKKTLSQESQDQQAVNRAEITGSVAKEQQHDVFSELYPKIKKWVGELAFKKLLASHSENQVRNAISYTLSRIKKGDTIENIGGHIVAMAKQKTIVDAINNKKSIAQANKQQQRQEETRKLDMEAQKKQIYGELHRKENAIVEAIFLELPEKKKEILSLTKQNRFSNYRPDLSDTENLQHSMFKAAFFNVVKKQFPKRFEALDKRYESKIKSINAALHLL